ncbi:MAG: radical SAM protein [Spirochaetales bacterium]|nr:radical SAM protein [Spirochaetales bacterium]
MSDKINVPVQPDLAAMLAGMARLWAGSPLRALWRLRRLALGFLLAALRRCRAGRSGLLVPMGIGLSPTMRCNLRCAGCYARFHSRDEEMPIEAIRSTVASAEARGVFLFVITGGEPYMRPEMLELYRAHRRSAFLTVSNGTLIDDATARRIAACANVLPMISIEGNEAQTDARRGPGVHRQVLQCMERLRRQGVLFGFSSVVARNNVETLGSDRFVAEMVERGCSVGFYNDLIPLSEEDLAHVPDPGQQGLFRLQLAQLRRRHRILLVHLPEDEYDAAGRCLAVGGGAMHINARGFAEPCPFAHYARENLCEVGFEQALRSPFLAAIRSHPTVLVHGEVGCALVHNARALETIAAATGARPTRSNPRGFTIPSDRSSPDEAEGS